MKKLLTIGSVMAMSFLICLSCKKTDAQTFNANDQILRKQNEQIINKFFVGNENMKFEGIMEIFSSDAVMLVPYAPDGFPKRLNGAEAVYKQFNGLSALFSKMQFPREIIATQDPNYFFVKFKGIIDIKTGGKYENNYIGTFRLRAGKIVEYTEYFDSIVMAKAFNLKIN